MIKLLGHTVIVLETNLNARVEKPLHYIINCMHGLSTGARLIRDSSDSNLRFYDLTLAGNSLSPANVKS